MARLVGGRFKLVRRIGRGGMGEVHLAQLESVPGVRKLAAIKLVRAEGVSPGEQSALLHEARVVARLQHPHVVQLLDAGLDDGAPWIALEYVAGVSLREVLVAGAGGHLSPWLVARLLADACSGLHAVHEAKDEHGAPLDVVHRDVSPQNVLVSWDGVVKLADFGVARSTLQSGVTTAGTIKGKLAYMAPEQARGGRVDRRTDVFAVGVILWEALAERRLFVGENETETLARVLMGEVPSLATVAPHVPEPLGVIAARALAHEPDARFATARDLQNALEAAMRDARVELGAREIAATLAHLLPGRVHEHEAWLKEASNDEAPAVAASALEPTRDAHPVVVPRRRWLGVVAVVGATLGAFALGTRMARTPPVPAPTPTASAAPPTPSSAIPPPSPDPTPMAPATGSSSASASATASGARPQPHLGTLDVGSRPVWSRVRVDGKPAGETPIVGLRVAAGTHVVEAVPQGTGTPMKRAVVVSPDGHARVVFDVP